MFKNSKVPGLEQVKEYERTVLPYSIKPINDINAYRAERSAFEIKWNEEYKEREDKTKAQVELFVAEQNKALEFTDQEKLVMKWVKETTPGPKHTPGMWSDQNEAVRLSEFDSWALYEEPVQKLSLKDRIIKFFSLAFEK